MAKDTTWVNGPLIQYGSTLAVAVVASVWRDAMVRNLGDTLPLYITFYPAVVIVSLVFGLRQGLLAILYSLLLVAYWNLPREGTRIPDLADVVGMVLFAAICVGMAVMAEVYRRTRDRAAAYPSTLAASLYARSVIEASLDPLVTISRDGKITDVNRATETGHRRSARRAGRQRFLRLLLRAGEGARRVPAGIRRWTGPRLSAGHPTRFRPSDRSPVQRYRVLQPGR